MGTKTDAVRTEIQEFLKNKGEGVKVRESELFDALLETSENASSGILRGIANKLKGIGGYIPIPNVEVIKEGSKSYYFYKAYHLPESSIIGMLQQKVVEFKTTLQRENLWAVSLLDMPIKDRQTYLEFVNRFEQLMGLFSETID